MSTSPVYIGFVTDVATPKHEVILNTLRDGIISGDYPVGSALPSESELGAMFDASRGTIRQAIGALKTEGLIHATRGRRPVVCARPIEQPIDAFFSFSSWVHAAGGTPGQRTISIARVRREHDPARNDRYPEGEFLVQLTRLRYIDNKPVMVERSVFHDSLSGLLMQFDTDSGSIYEHLISQNVPLDQGTHVLDAIPANKIDAELLDVSIGTPILRIRRQTHSAEGLLLEYSDDRYRSDQVTIMMRNNRGQARPTTIVSRNSPDASAP